MNSTCYLQGGVEELGCGQSGGMEPRVVVGVRDGLMRLLARRELMKMMTCYLQKTYIFAYLFSTELGQVVWMMFDALTAMKDTA